MQKEAASDGEAPLSPISGAATRTLLSIRQHLKSFDNDADAFCDLLPQPCDSCSGGRVGRSDVESARGSSHASSWTLDLQELLAGVGAASWSSVPSAARCELTRGNEAFASRC